MTIRRSKVNVMLVQTRISKGDHRRLDMLAYSQGMTLAAYLRYMIRMRISDSENPSTSEP